MSLYDSVGARTIQDMLIRVDGEQLDALLSWANTWHDSDPADYNEEVKRRMQYLSGDMETDLDALLVQEFPKSYKLMKEKKVMINTTRYMTEKLCGAFTAPGTRAYLVDENDEEIDAESKEAKAFDRLLKAGAFFDSCRECERVTDLANSAAQRVWYDDENKAVQFSTYDPLKAHVVVNPERTWDAHAAAAVLFERDGPDGPAGEPVFEVWGARADDVKKERDTDGLLMFHPTVHYMTSKAFGPRKINENDINPFIDPRSNKPVYPFSWWTNKRHTIYRKGGDERVKVNRLVNLGLTWLQSNIEWQASAIPVITSASNVDPSSLSKFKAQYMHHPKFMMELPPGCDLKFESPDKELAPFTSFYEMIIQYHALTSHLAPKSVSISDGLPQSGIALRIEMHNLVKHTEENQEMHRSHAERSLRIGIIEQNYYRNDIGCAEIGPKLRPVIKFGAVDTGPKDHKELAERYTLEIAEGVSTADDWVAEVYGCTKSEAAARVDENIKRTAEVNSGMTIVPADPTAAKDAETDIDDVTDAPVEPEVKTDDAAEIDRLANVNIYQLKVAIEAGAATPVDMRMKAFGEDRATATANVMAAMKFNASMAQTIGEIEAARQAPVKELQGGGDVPLDEEPELGGDE